VGLDDLVLHELAGMGWALHADAGCCAHDACPVIVLVVEVDDPVLSVIGTAYRAACPLSPGALRQPS
jgi:hypothetical protein